MLQKCPCHATTTPLALPVMPLCSCKRQQFPVSGKAAFVPIPSAILLSSSPALGGTTRNCIIPALAPGLGFFSASEGFSNDLLMLC